MNAMIRPLKRRVLPTGTKMRRLPVGIGRHLRMEIDFAIQTRLYLGMYETELNGHLRRLCRPGSDAFDIGGQFGYDALVMAKLTGGRVVSVDCDPNAVEQMGRNFAANPALADRLIALRSLVGRDHTPGRESVSVDQLAEDTFVPDILKMDIEGGEVDALLGAERVLLNRQPDLIIEVHGVDAELQCVELLQSKRYRPQVVDQRRWFPDHRPMDHNRWLVAEGRDPRRRGVGE